VRYELKGTDKYKTRLKRFSKLYARMLLKGDIDWVKLGNVYNTKEEKPEWKAKKLVRQQIVQEMTTKELLEITEEHGITAIDSLAKRKEVLDGAITDKNWSAANKSLDAFDEKLDLKPQRTVTSTTEEYNFSRHLPGGEKQQIKAKQSKEIEQNDTQGDDSE